MVYTHLYAGSPLVYGLELPWRTWTPWELDKVREGCVITEVVSEYKVRVNS
jgi:hypothetical protein